MFFHEFKYTIKNILRTKEEIFWVLLFPLLLSIMFHVAFGNINNTTENFHTIPVAVCLEEGAHSESFQKVLDTLSDESVEDTPFLAITYTNLENALTLLETNSVRGIFQVDDEISLTCTPSTASSSNATLAIEQSILESFLREYRTNAKTITEIAMTNPQKLPEVLSLMEADDFYGQKLSLTDGNMDTMVQYFYNLLAMACLYTSFAGADISINNHANLSTLAARKCVSPRGKLLSVIAHFSASLLIQFICIALNILFMVYVLKVNFAAPIPLLMLTAFISCILGISFGFFVGSLGRMEQGIKIGIMVAFTMVSSFLSGLMVGNMRSIVENICPLINDINPAVLISDSFLTLNIYGVTNRYTHNLFMLLLFSAAFLCIGCIKIRRKTYASL
ncbi:MAG: ABC transporter permease [Lachnospiraceae bacterium]|nr:ABC transporter permease [Lachnospiraceae bacterium]